VTHVKNGNWVRICKAFLDDLPINRSFSEIEAIYSLQCNADPFDPKTVSVSGLGKRWGWSRKRVRTFLKNVGVEIVYPKPTKEVQRQRGQIGLQKGDRKGTERGQKRFIDSSDLKKTRDRKGTDKGQKGDRKGSTINKKEEEVNLFEQFYSAYPKKKNKGQAEKAFEKIKVDRLLLEIMLSKIDHAKQSQDWQKEKGQYIPYPATWLNAKGWKDEIEVSGSPQTIKEIMAQDDGFPVLS